MAEVKNKIDYENSSSETGLKYLNDEQVLACCLLLYVDTRYTIHDTYAYIHVHKYAKHMHTLLICIVYAVHPAEACMHFLSTTFSNDMQPKR